MEDKDYAFALSLQNELFTTADTGTARKFGKKRERPTSVVDDSWETIDPTPDIRQLFLEFNDAYFEGKLAGCEVKWSSKMTLCAGLCCYEGRGGLCSIKLSIPLLKLRPRKDLVQTLLHEMIHALLFVTHNNKDHNAHGPEFQKHMYRINQQTGANITVYHNFHDEVDLYRQHWWRCTGSCKKLPPYYGYVKRAMNRAPSPRDPWWSEHQLKCGGTYVKVKEPEDYGKKKRKIKEESASSTSQPNSSGSGMRKIYDLWRKDSSSDDDAFKKGKENDVQKSNDVRLVNPFSGKGYVLGTVKKEISTVSRSCVENDSFTRTDKSPFKSDKSIICEESGGIPSKNIKTAKAGHVKKFTGSMQLEVRNKLENNDVKQREKLNIHEQLKKRERAGTNNELTIIDEFKRVGEAQKRSVVIVEDDTPAKHVQLVYDLVPCPVCQTKVEKDLINSHLDGCLT